MKRLNKIFYRATLAEIIIYLLMGLAGYYSMGNFTPTVIVLRDSLPDDNILWITIARIALALNLSFALATVGNPLRK